MSPATQTSQHVWLGEVMPRPGFLRRWEYKRHHQVHHAVECFAEFLGVFFYVWTGVGANISFILTNLAAQPGVGSLFQVGAGYGIGIVLALTVNVATSGGHINPCITLAFALFRGFPWKKVPTYILSQILGAYVACLVIYLQYKDAIKGIEEVLIAKGAFNEIMFTPNGIAGAFALYPNPGKPLGIIFWNEFVVDFMLALVIWACLDPSNFFAPPVAVPWIIGMAYAAAIWGYAPANLAANSARDVGARLMALTIWGTQASGGTYAAIAALTNIPATLCAALVYEFTHWDSSRVVAPGQLAHLTAHKAHLDRRLGANQADYYHEPNMTGIESGRHRDASLGEHSNDDKARVELRE